MTNDNKSGGPQRIGFLGALFLVFLVLKLTNFIGWSWWWITAPLWGPVALAVASIPFLVIYALAKGSKTSK